MCSIDPAIASVLAAKDAQAKSQVAFAVAAKSLESGRQQGDAAVQLIKAAAQLNRGLGRGTQFDAVT